LLRFASSYPTITSEWLALSEYLVQVSCKNETELKKYCKKAIEKGIKVIPFYEPDLENQLTAVALEPTETARKLISNLPKMLKNDDNFNNNICHRNNWPNWFRTLLRPFRSKR